jgi:hypothetical protein
VWPTLKSIRTVAPFSLQEFLGGIHLSIVGFLAVLFYMVLEVLVLDRAAVTLIYMLKQGAKTRMANSSAEKIYVTLSSLSS